MFLYSTGLIIVKLKQQELLSEISNHSIDHFISILVLWTFFGHFNTMTVDLHFVRHCVKYLKYMRLSLSSKMLSEVINIIIKILIYGIACYKYAQIFIRAEEITTVKLHNKMHSGITQ